MCASILNNTPVNPFEQIYKGKVNVILLAHGLIGTVRGKSANGLLMHSEIFNVAAIIDEHAVGKDTAKVCPGVNITVPVYKNVKEAISTHEAKALILLVPPVNQNINDINEAIKSNLDIINTSFEFIKNNEELVKLIKHHHVNYFDVRDVSSQMAYPNTNIVNRKAKVVFVTGTDCGLGKRTAAVELTREAKRRGINAVMYATGQTGLMLGEKGTVVDALVVEFSNGVVSQHVTELSEQGYELIFVEGQSDIYHPANSAVSLALLHGSNPDCIILVHDNSREYHKGFNEDASLYKMHPYQKHIQLLEMLSLPCGPTYKTVGIATIGEDNIFQLKNNKQNTLPVADVRQHKGPEVLLNAVLQYLNNQYSWTPKGVYSNI